MASSSGVKSPPIPNDSAGKSDSNGAASSSYFRKTVCLYDWWLVKADKDSRGNKLAVAGLTSREKEAVRLFSSAPISKRYDIFSLETGDGIVVILRGFINKHRTTQNGFSSQVFNHFLFGFPPYWEHYAANCFDKESSDTFSKKTSDDGNFGVDPESILDNGAKNCAPNCTPPSALEKTLSILPKISPEDSCVVSGEEKEGGDVISNSLGSRKSTRLMNKRVSQQSNHASGPPVKCQNRKLSPSKLFENLDGQKMKSSLAASKLTGKINASDVLSRNPSENTTKHIKTEVVCRLASVSFYLNHSDSSTSKVKNGSVKQKVDISKLSVGSVQEHDADKGQNSATTTSRCSSSPAASKTPGKINASYELSRNLSENTTKHIKREVVCGLASVFFVPNCSQCSASKVKSRSVKWKAGGNKLGVGSVQELDANKRQNSATTSWHSKQSKRMKKSGELSIGHDDAECKKGSNIVAGKEKRQAQEETLSKNITERIQIGSVKWKVGNSKLCVGSVQEHDANKGQNSAATTSRHSKQSKRMKKSDQSFIAPVDAECKKGSNISAGKDRRAQEETLTFLNGKCESHYKGRSSVSPESLNMRKSRSGGQSLARKKRGQSVRV